ncbi:MAG: hypothetical protein HDR20_08040 [Lachnospiraceae bacterium]|nr:hypothetical protein [Lachnospiraceae bacterium]
MDYDEFKEEVLKELRETHGDGMEITLLKVKKTNGADYEGVSFRVKEAGDGITASAIFRIALLYDEYVEGEMDIAACAEALWEAHEKSKNLEGLQQFVESIPSWETTRRNVYPALLSMEKNIDLLPKLVVFPMLDLAVIFVIRREMTGGGDSIVKITTELLEDYGISRQELYDAAMENLKNDGYYFQDMDDVVREISLLDDAEKPMGTGMYILSNSSKLYGAAGILDKDLVNEFAKGRDMYILPSSVHETIFVSTEKYCAEELDQMVAEINELEVLKEERLVDHCYFYDGKTGEIRMRP